MASWMTPTMPVGPSYRDDVSPSSCDRSGSTASPVTGVGRVWGTSARNAPSVTTSPTPISRAVARNVSTNARHRTFGSTPRNTTTSRSSTRAVENRSSGHSIRRVIPASSRTVGRVIWKSRNPSGSMSARGWAPHRSRRYAAAVEAASPPSFQPRKAAIRTGRSRSGRLVQVTRSTPPSVPRLRELPSPHPLRDLTRQLDERGRAFDRVRCWPEGPDLVRQGVEVGGEPGSGRLDRAVVEPSRLHHLDQQRLSLLGAFLGVQADDVLSRGAPYLLGAGERGLAPRELAHWFAGVLDELVHAIHGGGGLPHAPLPSPPLRVDRSAPVDHPG